MGSKIMEEEEIPIHESTLEFIDSLEKSTPGVREFVVNGTRDDHPI